MPDGVRLPDGTLHSDSYPGAYWRDTAGRWNAWPPDCRVSGLLAEHLVVEHDDQTIGVSPSILIQPNPAGIYKGWHGYLTRGVWHGAPT